MTPVDYKNIILPRILSSLNDGCICSNRMIRKIISFNYEDYGIGPTGLADAEILIQELIRENKKTYKWEMGAMSTFMCKKCGVMLNEIYEEYSINMSRTYICNETSNSTGLYLVGFYGFNPLQTDKINDFSEASDSEIYMKSLGVV